MARLVFHRRASADFREALVWYSARSRRAAQGFQQAIGTVLTSILAAPERYPLCEQSCREAIVTTYPFSIVYRMEVSSDILVVAMAHASREPGYWHGRVEQ